MPVCAHNEAEVYYYCSCFFSQKRCNLRFCFVFEFLLCVLYFPKDDLLHEKLWGRKVGVGGWGENHDKFRSPFHEKFGSLRNSDLFSGYILGLFSMRNLGLFFFSLHNSGLFSMIIQVSFP